MSQDPTLALATLDFLEAAYDMQLSDDVWLDRVLNGVCRIWGDAPWAFALRYDASDVHALKILGLAARELPSQVEALISPSWEEAPPEIVRGVFRGSTVGFGRPLGVLNSSRVEIIQDRGAGDVLGVNGVDPEGLGCAVCIGTWATSVEPSKLMLLHRVASHLSSAYRCRRRLRARERSPLDGAEAILHPDGRVLDAAQGAQSKAALEALLVAMRSIQDARVDPTTMDPSARWRPRVRTRWTLLDTPTPEGPLVVARENQAAVPLLEVLTERERQVVACAAYGRTNKETAYDLGISHSTARVLLARACARLGVRSREELLALPVIRGLRGETESARSSG